jgi:hypothetical protein
MKFGFVYQQQHNIHHAIQKKMFGEKNQSIMILTLAPGINRVFKSIGLPTYDYIQ